MALTLAQVRRNVVEVLGEPVNTTEVDDAITQAIEAGRDTLFVRIDKQAISLVAATYRYNLNAFAVVLSVDINNQLLPDYAWWPMNDSTAQIVLNENFIPTIAGTETMTVQGLGIQTFPSASGDFIGMDTDYLTLYAAAVLSGSRQRQVREVSQEPGLENARETRQTILFQAAAAALERARVAQALPDRARYVHATFLS